MIRVSDVMNARWCHVRCMVGFVCEHDRCMVKDVCCHDWLLDVCVCVCELDTNVECDFNMIKTLDTMMGSQP